MLENFGDKTTDPVLMVFQFDGMIPQKDWTAATGRNHKQQPLAMENWSFYAICR